MLHVYVYNHCLLFQFHVTCLVLPLFLFPCFMFYALPLGFFSNVLCFMYYHWVFFPPQFYVICITIGPVQDEVCPGPVHELGGVVWIKGSVVEPAHLFYRHSQSTVEKQTDLVPPCHGPTRVHGGFVD